MTDTVIQQIVSTNSDNTTSIEQTAAAIRQRAQEMVAKASLQQVRERMPEYVPVVEDLMSQMDVNNPLTLATVGSWALQDQAEAGLKLLSAVQQGPSRETLVEVDAFERDLRARIKPLEDRIKLRNSGQGVMSRVGALFGTARGVFATKEQKRAQQSEELAKQMQGFDDDAGLLKIIVQQTVEDTVKMKGILANSKHLPEVIEAQITHVLETHAEAAEKLYLSLVAINEFQNDLSTNKIPALEKTAMSPNAIDSDIDAMQRAKESLGLLETRRTDLMAAFLNTCLQRGMVSEMGKINALSAIERERLENIALPQMLGMLGTLALQQRTGELVAGTKAGNRIMADTTASMAAGFKQVLQLSMDADHAKLEAANAVVTATNDTLAAVKKFRTHEAAHITAQKNAQAKLASSVGELRLAAARLGQLPQDKRFAADNAATEALALQATGVKPTVETTAPTEVSIPAPVTAPIAAETPAPGRPVAQSSAEALFNAARNKTPKAP